MYEADGFARRIIDTMAEEMVRAGYDIEGVDEDEDIRSELEGVRMLPNLCDSLKWADLHGGALIVLLVADGGTFEDPLIPERATALEQIRVYSRWEVSRQQKYLDPNDSKYGKTELWMISPSEGTPYTVHESRCIEIDGVNVPSTIRTRNDGWGNSKLQQCYDQLIRYGMSHVWANALLERSQQGVHGIPDLSNILRTRDGETLVRKRIDLVDMARSVNNTIVIDAEESYELKSTSLSGVSDLIDRLGLALSAVSGMPESLLFGRTQSGLNSSGKSDLENWYAKVMQAQEVRLLPVLDKIVAIQLHVMGRFKDSYRIKFNPLSVPSEKDTIETDYKRAQTFEIYNGIGALDALEIRKMLPDCGYDLDDVEQLPEGTLTPEDAQAMAEAMAADQAAQQPVVVTDSVKEAQVKLLEAEVEAIKADQARKDELQRAQMDVVDTILGESTNA
jgi:phage-related protein (TIGR01555 family)